MIALQYVGKPAQQNGENAVFGGDFKLALFVTSHC